VVVLEDIEIHTQTETSGGGGSSIKFIIYMVEQFIQLQLVLVAAGGAGE
jgi:hypothetical protein